MLSTNWRPASVLTIDMSVSDQHIESILYNATHVGREFLRAIRYRKIGGDGVCATAVAPDLIDHCIGIARGAAIMDQHLSASFAEGQGGCTADAA